MPIYFQKWRIYSEPKLMLLKFRQPFVRYWKFSLLSTINEWISSGSFFKSESINSRGNIDIWNPWYIFHAGDKSRGNIAYNLIYAKRYSFLGPDSSKEISNFTFWWMLGLWFKLEEEIFFLYYTTSCILDYPLKWIAFFQIDFSTN